MSFKEEIEFYGEDILDLEISPFETMDVLHRRSRLHANYEKLTQEEMELLKQYDQKLLDNASSVYHHINKIYDFQNDKPIEEWWWHLDKIDNRQLTVYLDQGIVTRSPFISTVVEFESKEAYDQFIKWSRDKQIVIRQETNNEQKII